MQAACQETTQPEEHSIPVDFACYLGQALEYQTESVQLFRAVQGGEKGSQQVQVHERPETELLKGTGHLTA
jgi:hypothetical protein